MTTTFGSSPEREVELESYREVSVYAGDVSKYSRFGTEDLLAMYDSSPTILTAIPKTKLESRDVSIRRCGCKWRGKEPERLPNVITRDFRTSAIDHGFATSYRKADLKTRAGVVICIRIDSDHVQA